MKKGVQRNIETGEHFSATDHSIDDMTITILDHRPDYDEQKLRNLEAYYMCRLKTLQPTGLNKSANDLIKYFYNIF